MRALSTTRWISSVLFLLVPASLLGQQIPLTNWTVPPYHRASASGGITTMTDISPGVGFVAVQPCRVVDTRGGGVFTGNYGPPALAANAMRSFDIDSAANCIGIPDGAEAYSLNFTVVGTAGGPGDLRAWPTGNPPVQTTSVLNWTAANVIIANATIIGAGTDGSIDVTAAGFGTQLLIDINGYFTGSYNAGNQFVAVSPFGGGGAILGVNPSSVPGSHGVGGFAGGANAVHGVQGQVSSSGLGGSSGVHGINDSTAQNTYGVLGQASAVPGAAGVLGRDGSGAVAGASTGFSSAGVRGESKLWPGVLGISQGIGVLGALKDGVGADAASGYLGTSVPAIYGVLSNGDAHVNGTLTATMKPFVQPHPFDPSKEIRYVSLEGPHSEVYFRGTAQISQGVTRIPIPEHFRFVAAPGSYSTLVTPVGGMATVAVLSEGEDGIVVQASRNVKIHYVVYAERDAMRNPDPIIENVHFRPDPNIDLLAHVPDSYRKLMIQNGTLNADGTVNVETARRLGWDKAWEKRGVPLALKP